MPNKLVRNITVFACLAVAGCVGQTTGTTTTSTRPAQVAAAQTDPTPAPEPPKPMRYEAEVLIGANLNTLQKSLGRPDIVFGEKDARFLRYDGPDCAVHILMEADHVIEVTPRARNGRPLKKPIADECFHEMVKARRN